MTPLIREFDRLDTPLDHIPTTRVTHDYMAGEANSGTVPFVGLRDCDGLPVEPYPGSFEGFLIYALCAFGALVGVAGLSLMAANHFGWL